MNIQSLLSVLVPLVLVVYIGLKQVRWSPLDEGRIWRMPIVLGIIGVVTIGNDVNVAKISSGDIALLAVEAVISVAFGCIMGLITRIRPLAEPTEKARVESSSGWLGLVLWFVFIAIRLGFGLWANHSGSVLGASTGVILVSIAINRAARGAVMTSRLVRLHTIAAA